MQRKGLNYCFAGAEQGGGLGARESLRVQSKGLSLGLAFAE